MKINVAFPLISLRLFFASLKKVAFSGGVASMDHAKYMLFFIWTGYVRLFHLGEPRHLILNTPVCSKMHAHTPCCMYIGMFSVSLFHMHIHMKRHKYSLHEHKSAFPPLDTSLDGI